MALPKFNVVLLALATILKYFCSLLLLVLLFIPLVLVLPVLFFRLFVSTVIVRCNPKIDKLIATRSVPFALDDLYEKPTCPLLCVFTLEGTADLETMRKKIKTCIVEQKDSFGKLLKPEFQQYLTDFWGFRAWKWESKFDVKDHVRIYDGVHSEIFRDSSRPVTMTIDLMLEISNDLVFKPFKRGKSPWFMYLIHNLRESEDEPIQTAAILHTHHSLGDGFSFMKAFTKDLTAEDKIQAQLIHHVKLPNQNPMLYRIGSALNIILSAPYELLTEPLFAVDGINEWHVPEKQLQRKFNGAISPVLSMNYFQEITARHKVTFTVLLLECFTAAMRKFMIEAGAKVPKVIHCGFPLPVAGHPNEMTNHMKVCFISLPVGITDPLRRLEAIKKDVRRCRNLSYSAAGFYLQPLLGSLFTCMLRPVFRNDISTAVITNFPGPKNRIEMANCKLRSISFGGGFGAGNCGIGFGSISYNGTVRIAVGIDNGIVDNRKLPASKVIDYFLDEAQLLKKLTPA